MGKKRKPYRPKFDAARREIFLDLLRKGIRRSNACIKVGISRATFSKCMNTNETFAAEVAQAEYDSNELIEQAMFNTALKGNVTAQQVILYNRMPDRWKDQRNALAQERFEWEKNQYYRLREELDSMKAAQARQ